MTNTDLFDRKHDYLRISLTDRCNMRCSYCAPYRKNNFNPGILLSYEELHRLIKIFITHLGIKKIRFTGGEPLVRKDINGFFKMIKNDCFENNVKLGITTNGTLLNEYLGTLSENGIKLLNISLDSLNKNTFKNITGYDGLDKVLSAIKNAYDMEFNPLKINCVVLRSRNYNEVKDFVRLTENKKITVRFIEYMPFDSNDWNKQEYVSADEILNTIKEEYILVSVKNDKYSTSRDYRVPGFSGKVSVISPVSHDFCESCNRLRITADGRFKTCLFSTKEEDYNLKQLLTSGIYSDEEIAGILQYQLKFKKLNHPEIDELIKLNRDNMISIGG